MDHKGNAEFYQQPLGFKVNKHQDNRLPRFFQEPKRMFGPMFLNGLFLFFISFLKPLYRKILFDNQLKLIDIMQNDNN